MKAITARLSSEQKGFTLTELLAVLALMAILATIATLGVTSLLGAGDDARAAVDENTVSLAAAQFFGDSGTGRYPVSTETVGAPTIVPIDFDAPLPKDPTKTFVPDFLREVPVGTWTIDTERGKVFLGDVLVVASLLPGQS